MSEPVYLSLLRPDPLNRWVREDLKDCASMHRTLMRAFPDDLPASGARSAIGLLYRIEYGRSGAVRVLVQSRMRPEWERLPHGWHAGGSRPAVKDIGPVLERIEEGMSLRFRLLANPTRKICTKSDEEGRKSNGKRVELRGEEEWLEWLARKAEHHGFRLRGVRGVALADVVAQRIGRVVGSKPGANGSQTKLTFFGVLFEGALEVRDRARFLEAVRAGIGPGKAFGFGLLSVGPLGGG